MAHVFGENIDAGKRMPRPVEQGCFCTKADGYLGAWHAQPPRFPHGYKYSGGLGTYCSSHLPMAVYRPEVKKTFFCWGGTMPGNMHRPRNWDFCPGQLLHMVSFYDHETGMVPRPTLLFDKYCADTHDNPVMTIDGEGYIWIFSPSHGGWTTPSFIHRSTEPYSIDRFETVSETLYAYPQPWWDEKHGFSFIHARYQDGRKLFVMNSVDGREWSSPQALAGIEQGHYHVSAKRDDGVIGLSFNFHPELGGLDARTNLYYLQSADGGNSWTTVSGEVLETPICEIRNSALVRDWQSEGELVYLMDLNFDAEGNPAVLYLSSRGHVPGPDNGPRVWRVTKWDGSDWRSSQITESDCNYDCGCLLIDGDVWRVIGPTETGPQPWTPGGEMVLWQSDDAGENWEKQGQLTSGSDVNHTYARRVIGGTDEFVTLWADGDTDKCGQSFLYFYNLRDNQVYRLPPVMTKDCVKPEAV